MENRSQLIGILLIICALVFMFNVSERLKAPLPVGAGSGAGVTVAATADAEENFIRAPEVVDERLFTIGNDVIDVVISNVGGAIKSASLKKYRALQDEPEPVVFNDGSGINAMAVSLGDCNLAKFSQCGIFEVIEIGETAIKLARSMDNGCVLTRSYSLVSQDGKGADGYVVKHETSVKNGGLEPVNVGMVSLFLGVMPTMEGDSTGDYLNFGAFDGQKDFFIKLRDFKASGGFFGIGKREERKKIFGSGRVMWGSVKNQFFTAILTPKVQADGYVTWPVSIRNRQTNAVEEGISAAMVFDVGTIDCNEKWTLHSDFYIGPKDFSRLSSFESEQDRVMQFGFFGSISELLLRMMLKIHALIPNWGWTIVALTTIVKLLMWPLTAAQVRSSRKMASIQGPLKLIKEKFKNNPQKLQAETLKLFKENRINPAAGCLPILIQIPIFFGLYYMLRTSSDLRFAHFMWIRDLSLPDTVARIGRFPVNILPVIMGTTMFLQMEMTPIPTADNSQKLIFKLMPVIFLLCCYNFPSGLVLYWTVQNLLTMAQQFTMSRSGVAQVEVSPTDSRARTVTKSARGRTTKRRK
jgi:YidC/Oxa1 family membrane protein insertase